MILISDDDSFGTLLKSLRKRRHLTQHQLAEALGIHRSTLIRWEQGDYLPESKALVLELARHLQLDDQEARQLLEASLTALTPPWSVPLPRNPYFTGREEILEALHTRLGDQHPVGLAQSTALHGLGGVGKTQIALEYAYRYALEYSAVFWIGAETEEQMASGLLRVAEVLQLPGRDEKDQQRVIASVHHWLSTHGQWLLIVDNVEELTLLDRFLPAACSGAVLLTTRCQSLGTRAYGLDLAPMEPEEGLLFLLRRAKLLAPDAGIQQMHQFAEEHPAPYVAATALVEALGGLPLALDQAGAYLEATQCGVSAYLDLFHTRRQVLLGQRGEGARDHPASVSTTFTLALTSATQRYPAVGDLLRVCALVQPDAIPEELFRQGGSSLGPALEPVCRDPLEWDRLLAMACSSSLLSRQREEQTLSLHRLVQTVLLDEIPPAEQATWRRRVIQALGAVIPGVLQTQGPALWKHVERFLPHALLCLSSSELEDDPLPLASFASRVAEHLQMRGRYTEAERLCQHVVRLRERALGRDHPEVAFALNALATVCWKQGKHAEAETRYRHALRLWKEAYGPEHPDVARVLNNLAIISVEQGAYLNAKQLYRRALHLWERALGPDHILVGFGLTNLAEVYTRQGKYMAAEPLYMRSLHIITDALGSEHPCVADPLNGLAVAYTAQGKYAQAEGLFHRALCLREQQLGHEHPETAQTLYDLALLRRQQGRGSEARALAERARSIRALVLGDVHPQTVESRTLSMQLLREQTEGQDDSPGERTRAREAAQAHNERRQRMEKPSKAFQAVSYSAQHGPLQAFFEACCELHPRAWCRSTDLWQAYERWVMDGHERYPLSRRVFIAQVKGHGCRADRTNTARIWRGIALVDQLVTKRDTK